MSLLKKVIFGAAAAVSASFLFIGAAAAQTTYQAGQSYWDADEFIEYIPGTMPLVITMPHGGYKMPTEVLDRNDNNPGCPSERLVGMADARTIELGKAIRNSFLAQYGVAPYIVAAHIARYKVDLNRDREAATCGNALMDKAFDSWHGFIETAIKDASAQFGNTLYIDLHGHGHPKQSLELGYNLGLKDLQEFYETKQPPANHSLRNLPKLRNQQISLYDLFFTEQGFGSLVYKHGGEALPSAEDPHGAPGDIFFNGGPNTRRYTGTGSPNSFGWQIEVNQQARKTDNIPQSAKVISRAIADFLNLHGQFANNWQLPPPRAGEE